MKRLSADRGRNRLPSEATDSEVAGPEAYPAAVRKELGMTIRPPVERELQLLEGCLRAIPDFVARHRDEWLR